MATFLTALAVIFSLSTAAPRQIIEIAKHGAKHSEKSLTWDQAGAAN